MRIESIDYFVNILSDDEYTVRCVAYMSNGDEWPSIASLYHGNPSQHIESLELGTEDTLTVTDEREVTP